MKSMKSMKKKEIIDNDIENEIKEKPKKTKKSYDIESFMSSPKIKKKISMLKPENPKDVKESLKPVVIDEDNDSSDEIIRKLIHMVKYLSAELEDHKTYAEGTYCSLREFYRSNDTLEAKIDSIETTCDRIEQKVDNLEE